MGLFSLENYKNMCNSIIMIILKTGANIMKKLLITLISVFVLINIAFAQSNQQKIDRLVRAKIDAAYEKQIADAKLKQNPNDENSKTAKTASENFEKISRDLTFALEESKSAMEAELKESEEKYAKESAKAAEALYEKIFPEFVYFGVSGEIKEYILEELKKDPYWNIIDIYGEVYREDFLVHREGYNTLLNPYETHWESILVKHTVIESTSGTKILNTYNGPLLENLREALHNPNNFYLSQMKKEIEKEYYKYAKEYHNFSEIIDLQCHTVVMSYKDIPANTCYYTKENQSDDYLNTFNKINANRLVFVKCINSEGQQDLIDMYEYKNLFGGKCQDKLIANKDIMKKVNSTQFMPLNHIKTFKLNK